MGKMSSRFKSEYLKAAMTMKEVRVEGYESFSRHPARVALSTPTWTPTNRPKRDMALER